MKFPLSENWTKTAWFTVGSALAIALTGFFSAANPLIWLILFIGIGGGLLLLKNHHLGLIIVLIATLAGQFSRLPIGPGRGFLFNDLFLPIFIAAWLIKKIAFDRTVNKSRLAIPIISFIAIASLSLVNSLSFLETNEVISSSQYLIRFIEYAFLYFIAQDLITNQKIANRYIHGLTLFGVFLSITGFIQLAIFPDFREMQQFGWDPHIDRLLATWFDPNFVGGALSFLLALSIGQFLHLKKLSTRFWQLVAIGIMLVALGLTFSRSSYVAFAAAIGVISLFKSRKLLIGAVLATMLLITVSDRAQTRITNLYHSAAAFLNPNSIETLDATARLRVESWLNTFQIIRQRPLLGSGYNTYQFVQQKAGFLKDSSIHSASGSDSSILTIIATTGFIGIIPFLWIFYRAFTLAFKNWRRVDQSSSTFRGFNLGLTGGIATLLIHSIFVNSLLFPFISTLIWFSLAISDYQPTVDKKPKT